MTHNNSLKSSLLAWWHYGLGVSLFRLGIAGKHRRIHEFTMRQLQKASHKGHLKAQRLMATLLTYKGVGTLDKQAGVALLATQAEQGDAQSQFLYAEALLGPRVLKADAQSEAVRWYLAAAKQGNAMAALRLSKAYEKGLLGLEPDLTQSQYWSQQFMQHSKNMSSES